MRASRSPARSVSRHLLHLSTHGRDLRIAARLAPGHDGGAQQRERAEATRRSTPGRQEGMASHGLRLYAGPPAAKTGNAGGAGRYSGLSRRNRLSQSANAVVPPPVIGRTAPNLKDLAA
jgi:hypothetical protein